MHSGVFDRSLTSSATVTPEALLASPSASGAFNRLKATCSRCRLRNCKQRPLCLLTVLGACDMPLDNMV